MFKFMSYDSFECCMHHVTTYVCSDLLHNVNRFPYWRDYKEKYKKFLLQNVYDTITTVSKV